MQEFLGSVRRSLVFRTSSTADNDGAFGGFVDKIASIRKSRIGLPFTKSPPPRALPPSSWPAKENMPPIQQKEETPQIRWRRGELIGYGAFGKVYMGMNLDSGALLAVKQVLIPARGTSNEKAQAHIRELEEEVKLLKNLSHPNIVRYLGTAREEDALNILLEYVPGGSIASLLGKFGSFSESVIRKYTKQLLQGLEYLHRNGIMHRDIKGANILVDNRGCIKLADFGASKKVVELATMTGAKSMKGTPYWMAPEVILQTGHNFSADIWSVGCTVIEMATGQPPWCQYQEVTVLFHVGTTKSPPPFPEHLSEEAKDFLHKCLQTEPNLRASALELLQHPFVTWEYRASQTAFRRSIMENAGIQTATTINQKSIRSNATRTIKGGLRDICTMDSVRCSTVCPEKFSGTSPQWGTNASDDDICLIDDKDDFCVVESKRPSHPMLPDDFTKSLNPMCEPDDWPEVGSSNVLFSKDDQVTPEASCNAETNFAFPSEQLADDDDEVTESKIRAFLEEKALDLKKLEEEFYSTINSASPKVFKDINGDDALGNLPSKSPRRAPSRRLSSAVDVSKIASPVSQAKAVPDNGEAFASSSPRFSERQRIWKEELDKELEMERERLAERMRQAGGKTSSPNKRFSIQPRERLPFASPPK